MTRDEIIRAIAEVLAGIEVPMSLGMPLGAACEPWAKLHSECGFGYLSADEYEKWIREKVK